MKAVNVKAVNPQPMRLRSLIPLLTFAAVSAAAQAPQATAAPVTAIVFSDYECPFSSTEFFTLERLQQRFPGKLRVIYKNSPLALHPDAPLAHRAALAAGRQGKLQAMAELLYANQQHESEPDLLHYAAQLKLDMPRFRQDLHAPETAGTLADDLAEADGFNVQVTPTLFLNGTRMNGVQNEDTLAALIQKQAATVVATPTLVPASEPVAPGLLATMLQAPTAALGNASAPMTIIEFTDFQCPYCRAAVAPMEQFVNANGQQVRWEFRSFPLDFHKNSQLAHEAALAAGDQGKFWPMHDLLFAHQDALQPDDLRRYALQLGLDMTAFDAALSSHRFAGQVAADRVLGEQAGVTGTPTFIIDGRMMVGARSLPELNQMLATRLAQPAAGAAAVASVVLPAATPDRLISGFSSAPVTLLWFSDVRSPQAAGQAQAIHALTSRYEGRVRVLFKALPLQSRPDAREAAAVLLAAQEQGKFWPMFDALAARRDTLDTARLKSLAAGAGLNRTELEKALPAAATEVAADLEDAARRGILGAPVIFVNTERIDGLQREAFYTDAVDRQLKATTAALTR